VIALGLLLSACARKDPELPIHELKNLRAPGIELPALSGVPVRAPVSGRVQVVGFWATWSHASRAMLPKLDDLATRYAARGVDVVGVSVDDPMAPGELAEKLANYTRAVDARFPNVWDDDRRLARAYYVRTVPTVFVVNRDGLVVSVFAGYSAGVDVEIEDVVSAVAENNAATAAKSAPK
jgi:thiol-disulfide isomerase/thioredoxin